jgi:hypothetical protein
LDNCTAWFEGSWSHCCAAHDVAYDDPILSRLTADLQLASCVAAAAGWPMAAVMFCGVVMFGWLFRKRRAGPVRFASPTLMEVAVPDFDVLMSRFDAVEARLDFLVGRINRLTGMALGDARRDKAMAQSTEQLRAAVAAQQDATQSAITLIQGLADQIEEALGDDAEVERIAGEIRASAQNLAQAVTENTPFTPSGNP